MKGRERVLGAEAPLVGIAARSWRRRWFGVFLVGLFLHLAFPGHVVATTPEEAIAFANQQRAAYGIPPLALDQSSLQPECNLGNHQIASPSTAWSATSSPWDDAPWHESVLYDPGFVAASYGEYNGFASNDPSFPSGTGIWACMWFRHDETFHSEEPPKFYWAAEATGPAAVPPTMSVVGEWPQSPVEEVGLTNPTGPNLIVWAIKPDLSYTRIAPVAATVTSASGESLPVRIAGEEGDSAILVVANPVQPLANFQVSVTWEVVRYEMPTSTSIQTFSFTTGATPPLESAVTKEVRHTTPPSSHHQHSSPVRPVRMRLAVHGSTITISGPRPLRGREVHVRISRKWVPCAVESSDRSCNWTRKGHALKLQRRMSKMVRLHFQAPGPWERATVYAKTRGFTLDGHRYAAGRAYRVLSGPRTK